MAAHIKGYYPRTCGAPRCSRVARFVVMNQYNAEIGFFCERHPKTAERLRDELLAGEERQRERGEERRHLTGYQT